MSGWVVADECYEGRYVTKKWGAGGLVLVCAERGSYVDGPG